MNICVSIASYRDPDLINTVTDAWEKAKNKDNISFCVVSQAEDFEHPNLSFVPRINYHKYHWKKSLGVCWARNIAIHNCDSDYILQIDSHTRFPMHWDSIIEYQYSKSISFWGDRIILTQYPYEFVRKNDKDSIIELPHKLKTYPVWDKKRDQVVIGKNWNKVEDTEHGDEVFHFAGGCSFASNSMMKEILPDPEIYFSGEEISLAIRAYTRGIRLITPGRNFAYSNYSRDTGRKLHWQDHSQSSYVNKKSLNKVKKILSGEVEGFWGIESRPLYRQFLKLNNMEFLEIDVEK